MKKKTDEMIFTGEIYSITPLEDKEKGKMPDELKAYFITGISLLLIVGAYIAGYLLR